jgi:hypothetical protein
MTYLISCIGQVSGANAHVKKIIEQGSFEKVFIITDNKNEKLNNAEMIYVNLDKLLPELVIEIKEKLDGKINDTEVALNLIAGSGKLHMAVLSSLLKCGLGIRLVALTKQGIKEI